MRALAGKGHGWLARKEVPEIIEALRVLIEKHGDLPVMADDADTGYRLPVGICYRPKTNSDDKRPRFEIKTNYHDLPDGYVQP